MSKFNRLYKKIIAEAVQSADIKLCSEKLSIDILDHEKNRQVRLVPCFKLKLNCSDRIADKNFKVTDIFFSRTPNVFQSPVYLAAPVDRYNEASCAVKVQVDIDKLSEKLKSFLRSEDIDALNQTLRYWTIADKNDYEAIADKLFGQLAQLILEEYNSNEDFYSVVHSGIGRVLDLTLASDQKARAKKEAEEEFERSLERDSEAEPEFVEEDDEDGEEELKFSHWFRGKGGMKYQLVGARITAHAEDESFDYEYGSAHGVRYDYSVYIDDLIWLYKDADGNSGEVNDNEAEEKIGLRKNDLFKKYIEDWYLGSTSKGQNMRTGYDEW